ncbi:MAG: hypothetical protein ACRDY1_09280 [Acidimicrobiales bacterium]
MGSTTKTLSETANATPAYPVGAATLTARSWNTDLRRPLISSTPCTYNGQSFIGSTTGIPDIVPGETINVQCSGFEADQPLQVFEGSTISTALFGLDETPNLSNFFSDVDTSALANVSTNGSGTLSYTFTVPNPFSASDLSASCPVSQIYANSAAPDCFLFVRDPSASASDPTAGIAFTVGLAYSATPVAQSVGYWEIASDGGIFSFNAPFYGSMGGQTLDAPIVGMALDPDTGGYWEVASDGGVFAFHAPFYGSEGGKPLHAPIVGIVADPMTGGYWLVASDGGIFSFNAPFYGSMGGRTLNAPIVGMSYDLLSGGYREVASDGGIFTFNDLFLGSTGGVHLVKPVVGMADDADSAGYREVASDGGLFDFNGLFDGSPVVTPFDGSEGGKPLVEPVVGMAADPVTEGYWEVASDGGVFSFDAPFLGSEGGKPLDKPVVGMVASNVVD